MTAIAQLPHIKPQQVHIKSKYGAEYRRFSVQPLNESATRSLLKNSSSSAILSDMNATKKSSRSQNSNDSQNSSASDQRKLLRLAGITFAEFSATLAQLHRLSNDELQNSSFKIFYNDKKTGSSLPINNDDNLAKAISSCQENEDSRYNGNLLRLFIYDSNQTHNGVVNVQSNQGCASFTPNSNMDNKDVSFIDTAIPDKVSGVTRRRGLAIGSPVNFRPVSAIIDVDVLPESLRRVRLHKHKSDKPLGFFIRDGSSIKMGPHGLEKVPAIFISRLVKDGLAYMTGLLSVNDEVLEVNGIDVSGKTLDQVTHMMIANSENLIITVRPENQKNNPVRNKTLRNNSLSGSSQNLHRTNSYNYNNKMVPRTPIIEPLRSKNIPPDHSDEDTDQVIDLYKQEKSKNCIEDSVLSI